MLILAAVLSLQAAADEAFTLDSPGKEWVIDRKRPERFPASKEAGAEIYLFRDAAAFGWVKPVETKFTSFFAFVDFVQEFLGGVTGKKGDPTLTNYRFRKHGELWSARLDLSEEKTLSLHGVYFSRGRCWIATVVLQDPGKELIAECSAMLDKAAARVAEERLAFDPITFATEGTGEVRLEKRTMQHPKLKHYEIGGKGAEATQQAGWDFIQIRLIHSRGTLEEEAARTYADIQKALKKGAGPFAGATEPRKVSIDNKKVSEVPATLHLSGLEYAACATFCDVGSLRVEIIHRSLPGAFDLLHVPLLTHLLKEMREKE